eukprot:m.64697 g.64697  ORF g.64697 m.64697 type:complete len:57 (-) comp15893_c0_seq13:798-968(-)
MNVREIDVIALLYMTKTAESSGSYIVLHGMCHAHVTNNSILLLRTRAQCTNKYIVN